VLIINVRGDGNCAFYAVMQFLYYKEGTVFQNINDFQQSIKEYMQTHEDILCHKDYCGSLYQGYIWMELFSTMYDLPLTIPMGVTKQNG
jgi:hypothetical protein